MTLNSAKKVMDFSEYGLEELSSKHKRVIAEYLVNGNNQTRAWMSVYPNQKYDIAKVEASKFFTNPNIKESISKFLKGVLENKQEYLDHLIFDYWFKRATYDISTFVDSTGNPSFKTWEEVPVEWRCCVDAIETVRYGKDGIPETKLKLADKEKALYWLDKLIGMTKEVQRHELTGKDGKDLPTQLNLSINGTPTVSKLPDEKK